MMFSFSGSQRSEEFDHISSENGYTFLKNSAMGGLPQNMLHLHYPNSNSIDSFIVKELPIKYQKQTWNSSNSWCVSMYELRFQPLSFQVCL